MTIVVRGDIGCWTCALLACLACVVACGDSSPHAREAKPAVARPAAHEAHEARAPAEPDDGLLALDGPSLQRRMQTSGDKATLVSVWASWCGSCKKELPMIANMAPALRAEGIGLVLISADEAKDRSKAAAMRRDLTPTQPGFIVRGELAPFKRVLNPNWQGSLPSTFLFDAQGALRYFWPGPVFDYEIEPILSMFLAGQPLQGPTLIERGPPG